MKKNELIDGARKYLNSLTKEELINKLVKRQRQVIKKAIEDNEKKHITPWGSWQVLAEGLEYKVKRIIVKSHHRFSLQFHNHRDEHWVIISGRAQITLGDKIIKAKPGDYIFVPKETKHRLQNSGIGVLIVIEVQNGLYLEEDDIVRLEDDYGRVE